MASNDEELIDYNDDEEVVEQKAEETQVKK
jgi:hypothetical protein